MGFKKLIVFTVILLFGLLPGVPQEPVFVRGDKIVHISIGMGSALYTGMNYKTSVPPLSISPFLFPRIRDS